MCVEGGRSVAWSHVASSQSTSGAFLFYRGDGWWPLEGFANLSVRNRLERCGQKRLAVGRFGVQRQHHKRLWSCWNRSLMSLTSLWISTVQNIWSLPWQYVASLEFRYHPTWTHNTSSIKGPQFCFTVVFSFFYINRPIFIIFGTKYAEVICNTAVIDFPTSPA